jgi:hypothetical protein
MANHSQSVSSYRMKSSSILGARSILYTDLIARVARVPVDDVMVAFIEKPFENVMEAGVRLPALGEEKAWRKRFGGQIAKAER